MINCVPIIRRLLPQAAGIAGPAEKRLPSRAAVRQPWPARAKLATALLAALAIPCAASAREATFGPEGARLLVQVPEECALTEVPNGLVAVDRQRGLAVGLATGRLHGIALEAAANAVAGAAGASRASPVARPSGAGAFHFPSGTGDVLFFEVGGRYVMVAREGSSEEALALVSTLRPAGDTEQARP